MKDRLIDLVDCATREYSEYSTEMAMAGNYGIESMGEFIADKILADGWMRPPCKVGQTVYKPVITDDTKEPVVWEIIITYISADINEKGVDADSSFVVGHLKNTVCGESAHFSDFGKTVFFTREEAEKALQGVEG